MNVAIPSRRSRLGGVAELNFSALGNAGDLARFGGPLFLREQLSSCGFCPRSHLWGDIIIYGNELRNGPPNRGYALDVLDRRPVALLAIMVPCFSHVMTSFGPLAPSASSGSPPCKSLHLLMKIRFVGWRQHAFRGRCKRDCAFIACLSRCQIVACIWRMAAKRVVVSIDVGCPTSHLPFVSRARKRKAHAGGNGAGQCEVLITSRGGSDLA